MCRPLQFDSSGGLHSDRGTLYCTCAGEARETVKFSGAVTDADALKEFITAEKMPLTIEFNQGNSEKIFNSGIAKQLILWAGTDELKAGSKVGFWTTSKLPCPPLSARQSAFGCSA